MKWQEIKNYHKKTIAENNGISSLQKRMEKLEAELFFVKNAIVKFVKQAGGGGGGVILKK